MTTIDRSQLIHTIMKQRQSFQGPTAALPRTLPMVSTQPSTANATADTRPPETVLQGLAAAQPRLISETLDPLERGFRRTQVYRQSDGRDFIRNEEVTLNARGMTRTVTQQNPSGSHVMFEENLDRQSDGAFRRTVRFTDETGTTQTRVDDQAQAGVDRFILSGGAHVAEATPYEQKRGVYLNQLI